MISIERTHDFPLILNISTLKNKYLKEISFHRCILNNLDFSGSVLENIDCRSAEMIGTNFTTTTFNKCQLIMIVSHKACYDMCNFRGTLLLYSDFEGSTFKGADLSQCVIKKTKFKNCDLRGANLDCEGLETCDLEGALYDDMTVWHKSYNVAAHGAIKVG
ncbi:MAG: pentapeptide repeat-containing protein [Lachnospiraceae bacterium]|nr:pentapeptide repeat-containing protein [Lachnospiraceae bacterium]